MHAPGAVEEDAATRLHRVGLAEQVLEDRQARAARVAPLAYVGELLGIAEQHDAASGVRDRQRVGQRHLAGLVHE
jgi:hypothetical protein